ncbi:TPA: hypothetical protein DEP58_04875 [Patescibacteria group bacterium]|nr:MAG: Conserved hypothetical integral membrane protein [Parcubacteria group bacterium GW2011_GWD2_42_14]HCC05599.1 hypothetical protein [Patescibacteria group bacterium]
MSFIFLVIWVLAITSFTLLGSVYAKKVQKPDLLIALYVTFTLTAQLLAVKISTFDLGFTTLYGPSGVLLFSVTYLFTDIVNERFGRKETQRMIFIAFITQVAMVFFFWLSIQLTPAPFWTAQDMWATIFGTVPRITVASWIAFLITENIDAYVFSWFKAKTHGKHLWARNVFSSIPALTLDSLIFLPIAFAGVLPLWPLIVGQTTIKWLVGLLNIPFMYLNRLILDWDSIVREMWNENPTIDKGK